MRVVAKRIPTLVVAVCALAVATSSSVASGAVETVTSSEGRYAWGDGWAGLSDDRWLEFVVYFSRAEGVKAGGPALGKADLQYPIGSFGMSEVTRVHDPGPNQPATTTRAVCSSLENVSSYDVGRRTTMDMGGWGVKPVWTDLWFDVDCDGFLGYDFFRVHFVASRPSELYEAATVDSDKLVSVSYDVDYVVSEEQAQRVARDEGNRWWYASGAGPGAFLYRLTGQGQHLPEFTPVSAPKVGIGASTDAASADKLLMHDLYAMSQTWHAGGGYDPAFAGKLGWFGYTTGQPLQRQKITLRLCGHRDGAEVHCYRSGGFGDIFPSVVGMTQVLHSPDAE
jgi:hypothetical protein